MRLAPGRCIIGGGGGGGGHVVSGYGDRDGAVEMKRVELSSIDLYLS